MYLRKKEEFYVQKYTKGRSASLVQECSIEPEKLPILQNIFNIDPNHPDVLVRNMFTIYHINEKQAMLLQPHISLKFQFDKYTYSIDGTGKFVDDWTGNPIVDRWYSVCEYQKLIPWKFVEEYKLNISLNFLREVFKDNISRYDREPTDITFGPKISAEYVKPIQPYVSFKFELDKYDYWIEKRAEGEKRKIGLEGEEFVG